MLKPQLKLDSHFCRHELIPQVNVPDQPRKSLFHFYEDSGANSCIRYMCVTDQIKSWKAGKLLSGCWEYLQEKIGLAKYSLGVFSLNTMYLHGQGLQVSNFQLLEGAFSLRMGEHLIRIQRMGMGRYWKIQAQYTYSVSNTNFRQQSSVVPLLVEIKYADCMKSTARNMGQEVLIKNAVDQQDTEVRNKWYFFDEMQGVLVFGAAEGGLCLNQ